MEYGIRQLAELAGVSTRTLRYYDQIGLLHPSRVEESGYRYYGQQEVDLLQQILFYRERELDLATIRQIVTQPDFDIQSALQEHLKALSQQQERLSALIETVKRTIAEQKGEGTMGIQQKFEAFKRNRIEENEKKYGNEARSRYGNQAVDDANSKVMSWTEPEAAYYQQLEQEILSELESAVHSGSQPAEPVGKKIMELHREWLQGSWKSYSPQAHRGLAQMYLADERFQAYYDRNLLGCTAFLVEAILTWA